MTHKPTHSLLSLLTLFFLSACVDSPLLRHSNADPETRDRFDQIDPRCPLSFPRAGLCASLVWENLPSDESRGSFILRFWDAKTATEHGPYLTPSDSVFVKLWMPSMGHGSSPVKTETLLDAGKTPIPGVYRASEVFFVMGGEWEIWIQLRKEKEVREQEKIDFSV